MRPDELPNHFCPKCGFDVGELKRDLPIDSYLACNCCATLLRIVDGPWLEKPETGTVPLQVVTQHQQMLDQLAMAKRADMLEREIKESRYH